MEHNVKTTKVAKNAKDNVFANFVFFAVHVL